jgi:hypothetical protein
LITKKIVQIISAQVIAVAMGFSYPVLPTVQANNGSILKPSPRVVTENTKFSSVVMPIMPDEILKTFYHNPSQLLVLLTYH